MKALLVPSPETKASMMNSLQAKTSWTIAGQTKPIFKVAHVNCPWNFFSLQAFVHKAFVLNPWGYWQLPQLSHGATYVVFISQAASGGNTGSCSTDTEKQLEKVQAENRRLAAEISSLHRFYTRNPSVGYSVQADELRVWLNILELKTERQ